MYYIVSYMIFLSTTMCWYLWNCEILWLIFGQNTHDNTCRGNYTFLRIQSLFFGIMRGRITRFLEAGIIKVPQVIFTWGARICADCLRKEGELFFPSSKGRILFVGNFYTRHPAQVGLLGLEPRASFFSFMRGGHKRIISCVAIYTTIPIGSAPELNQGLMNCFSPILLFEGCQESKWFLFDDLVISLFEKKWDVEVGEQVEMRYRRFHK